MWNGSGPSEHAVTLVVNRVRRKLRDRGWVICSVRGGGYRFDGLCGAPQELAFGELRIDPLHRRAWDGPDPIDLTLTETSLLSFLAQHAGIAFSTRDLIERVWGTDCVTEQTVRLFVFRLRGKLGKHAGLIVTVHGGYRFGAPTSGGAGEIVVGDLHVDPTGRSASIRGRELELTRTEFRLLSFLAAHPQIVFSQHALLEHVWNDVHLPPRTVAMRIGYLRRKLGADAGMIVNVRGEGYKLVPKPDRRS